MSYIVIKCDYFNVIHVVFKYKCIDVKVDKNKYTFIYLSLKK